MFFSYIKFAWRNFKKNKVYTFINISGLTIGMVCSFLILMWITDELNYDRFQVNRKNIYRILVDTESANNVTTSSTTPNTLGPVLAANYSDITAMTRYVGGFSGWLIRYEDKSFTNDRWAAADPAFFQMFSFPFILGNPATALQEQQSVVITDKMAQKYFGDDIALGKVIKKDNTDLYVTGIIHIPENSHIQFDYIFPIENMRQWFYQDLESWDVGIFRTYIQVRPGFSGDDMEKKIASIIPEHNPQTKAKISLQPLTDIHLRTNFQDQCNYQQGNITYVYIFSLVALCVLLVACINFMNMSTSRSSIRVKEIGVRKAIGARRKELISQLLGESIMYAFISMLLAIFVIKLLLPMFTNFIGKNLEFLSFTNFKMLLLLAAITFIVGIFAGSYPAFVLSSFSPINTLKAGLVTRVPSHSRIRNILVVIQFFTASVFIIGSLVFYQQLYYMQHADKGYDKDNIVYFYGYGKFMSDYNSAREVLLQNPNIMSISKAFPPFYPGEEESGDFMWPGKDVNKEFVINHKIVDYDYLKTFGISMAAGRFFNSEMPTDLDNFVLNETAVKEMGLQEPLGKTITYKGRTGQIIGVMKDFHHTSFHSAISPFIFEMYVGPCYICVKMKPDNIPQTLAFIEGKWHEYVPDRPFSYMFFNDIVDSYYQNEQRYQVFARAFTILAIFISCLGLLGLCSFMVERRSKEIGIRKVLGASVPGLFYLLSRDFISWVALANLLAWPVAWYAMHQWLQNFAYRVSMNLWLFILAGIVTVLIALAMIGFQVLRAASANPVEALRYE